MKKVIGFIMIIGSILLGVFLTGKAISSNKEAKEFKKNAVVTTGVVKSVEDKRVKEQYDKDDDSYRYTAYESYTVEYKLDGNSYTYSFKDSKLGTFSNKHRLDDSRKQQLADYREVGDTISLSVDPKKPESPRLTSRVDAMADNNHMKTGLIFVVAFCAFFIFLGVLMVKPKGK